jgi:hypothetical protein
MKRFRRNSDDFEISDRRAFLMCKSKRKLKSNKAGRRASRLGQRKYECPICGGWHLTKSASFDHEP